MSRPERSDYAPCECVPGSDVDCGPCAAHQDELADWARAAVRGEDDGRGDWLYDCNRMEFDRPQGMADRYDHLDDL